MQILAIWQENLIVLSERALLAQDAMLALAGPRGLLHYYSK